MCAQTRDSQADDANCELLALHYYPLQANATLLSMRQRFTADFKPCLQLLAGTEIALNARK
ncbi:hypothetical protein CA603_33745 [Paraburkholderia hospita]|nr:hypothetical protein CA603_33745 [Paraburkholderia hospita]